MWDDTIRNYVAGSGFILLLLWVGLMLFEKVIKS